MACAVAGILSLSMVAILRIMAAACVGSEAIWTVCEGLPVDRFLKLGEAAFGLGG